MNFLQDVFPIPPREELDGALVVPRGYVRAFDSHLPKYPRGDYSTGLPIMAALGSLWTRYFQERDILASKGRADSVMALQAYLDYLEAVAVTSRFECPVFHRRQWFAIFVRESELDTGRAALLQYGGPASHDSTYKYGVPIGDNFYAVDLGELKHVGAIMNRIVEPSAVWIAGTDYHVENGALMLRINPFNDARFPVRNIVDASGAVADREVVLWGFSTLEDWSYLYQHYGYALHLTAASSRSYKDFINGMWNGFVGGLSVQDLELAIAAAAGIPAVIETREIVEENIVQLDKTVVVTDQHAYIYPAGSVTRYAVGDVVRSGQCLVDTVMVFDLASWNDIVDLITRSFVVDGDRLTSSSSFAESGYSDPIAHRSPSLLRPPENGAPLLSAIMLTRGFLDNALEAPLAFQNVAGTYDTATEDSDGVVIGAISNVSGADSDITMFWAQAHARGLSAGETWLDVIRPVPSFVNPAGFAIEHFLRNNALVVYLRQSGFGDDALGTSALEVIRRVLPPQKTLLFIIDSETADTLEVTSVCETGEITASMSSSAIGEAAGGGSLSSSGAGQDLGEPGGPGSPGAETSVNATCAGVVAISAVFADSGLGPPYVESSSSAAFETRGRIVDFPPDVFYGRIC